MDFALAYHEDPVWILLLPCLSYEPAAFVVSGLRALLDFYGSLGGDPWDFQPETSRDNLNMILCSHLTLHNM